MLEDRTWGGNRAGGGGGTSALGLGGVNATRECIIRIGMGIVNRTEGKKDGVRRRISVTSTLKRLRCFSYHFLFHQG